jgi:hypothetical protein
MPTYYHPFDLTTQKFTFTSTSTAPNGFTITDFSDDSRGTPRQADWDDLENFSDSDIDGFASALDLSGEVFLGWTSFNDGGTFGHVNKYYRRISSTDNRAYYTKLAYGSAISNTGGYHAFSSSNTTKRFGIGSWRWSTGQRALVYFPEYKANGGHKSLSINNSIYVGWSDSNNRFESQDGDITLSHDGSTWKINMYSSISSGTLSSNNVPSYVDPASSDIDWANGHSIQQGITHANSVVEYGSEKALKWLQDQENGIGSQATKEFLINLGYSL